MSEIDEKHVIELCKSICLRETSARYLVWDRLRPWLATKGYDLYCLENTRGLWYPQHYVDTDPDLFFAETGGELDIDPSISPTAHQLETFFSYRVGYAQDASFRHLCLKLIELGSEEHKILTFLHKNKEEAMLNCVMPVLDFLDIGDYSFAIMPRWGVQPDTPWFSTVREAGTFIRDILKAYAYLHKHFIVYQDIKLGNILLSHFGALDELYRNEVRVSLRRRGRIRYAICDFDSSFLLSPSPSGKPIRLPGELSFDIYQPKPYDTSQGEPDYDPFVFDIGCLGIVFWELFATNAQNFPLIVPLVDKMITWKLEERFSAEEALQFVENHILNGSVELLDQSLEPRNLRELIDWDPDRHDKWANLPADFVTQWGIYKAPKSRWRDYLLRKICTKIYYAYEVVKFFRSYFRCSV